MTNFGKRWHYLGDVNALDHGGKWIQFKADGTGAYVVEVVGESNLGAGMGPENIVALHYADLRDTAGELNRLDIIGVSYHQLQQMPRLQRALTLVEAELAWGRTHIEEHRLYKRGEVRAQIARYKRTYARE